MKKSASDNRLFVQSGAPRWILIQCWGLADKEHVLRSLGVHEYPALYVTRRGALRVKNRDERAVKLQMKVRIME